MKEGKMGEGGWQEGESQEDRREKKDFIIKRLIIYVYVLV